MRLFPFITLCCVTLFSASLSSGVTPEEMAKRQCRSVHVVQDNMPVQAQALYNVVRPQKSAPGTYFCAMNFDDGYIGFQEFINGQKVIIFSIWDPVAHGDNPNDVPEHERTQLLQLGDKAQGGRFGGEGTGGQSFIAYDWSIDEPMRFVVCVKKDGDFKEISGFYFNNKTNTWDLISRWKTHSSSRELSMSVGFVEDFRRNFESATQERAAIFGPSFAFRDGRWSPNRSVIFSADENAATNVKAEIQPNGSVLLQTGGNTKMTDFRIFERRDVPQTLQHPQPDEQTTQVVKENI